MPGLSSTRVSPAVAYATLLSSSTGVSQSLGSYGPCVIRTTDLSQTQAELLADNGVVSTVQKRPGVFVFYKGRATNKKSSPTVIACYRGVCRSLIPALYQTIGNVATLANKKATNAVQTAFADAITRGCPILDYTASVTASSDTISVSIEMQVAGSIESIPITISVTDR